MPAVIAKDVGVKIAATLATVALLGLCSAGEFVCLHCLYLGSGPASIGLTLITLGLVMPMLVIVSGILGEIWVA